MEIILGSHHGVTVNAVCRDIERPKVFEMFDRR
jgi:hypothetical protein